METLIDSKPLDILDSPEAQAKFIRRAAQALTIALTDRGAEFHAVNEETALGSNGFTYIAQLALFYDHGWTGEVSAGLACIKARAQVNPLPSLTTLSDSELRELIAPWADLIVKQAKHLVFANLYCPRAVEYAGQFNDLSVAFRIVRAWDPVCSQYLVRFDSIFKNLAL